MYSLHYIYVFCASKYEFKTVHLANEQSILQCFSRHLDRLVPNDAAPGGTEIQDET